MISYRVVAACLLPAAAWLASTAPAQAQAQWRVESSAWLQPRSAEAVLAMRPVAEAVHAWDKQSGATFVIHYPGGEEGELRAAELHDWLVALGIPSKRIDTVPGGEPEGLGLEVVSAPAEDP
jgi:hypothetical protein